MCLLTKPSYNQPLFNKNVKKEKFKIKVDENKKKKTNIQRHYKSKVEKNLQFRQWKDKSMNSISFCCPHKIMIP